VSLPGPFQPLSRLVVARMGSAVLQFATLILITRSVSIGEFGDYSTALGVGAVLSGLLGFGLMTKALRISADPLIPMARPIVTITVLAALVVSGAVFAFAALFGHGWALWAAAATYVGSEMIVGAVQGVLFGEMRRRRGEALIVLRRAVPLVPIAVGAVYAPEYVFHLAAAGFVLSAGTALTMFGVGTWGGWHLRAVIGGSFQYWMSSIWSMLQQLDVLIVNAILGSSAAGSYSAGFRLASPIHLVTSSLIALMVPKLSGLRSHSERLNAGKPYMLAAAGYAGILVVCAPLTYWGGPLLFGQQYAATAWVFPVFILNSAFSVVSQVQAARLYSNGVAKPVTRNIATTSVLALVFVSAGSLTGEIVVAASLYAFSSGLLVVLHQVSWRRYAAQAERDDKNEE